MPLGVKGRGAIAVKIVALGGFESPRQAERQLHLAAVPDLPRLSCEQEECVGLINAASLAVQSQYAGYTFGQPALYAYPLRFSPAPRVGVQGGLTESVTRVLRLNG